MNKELIFCKRCLYSSYHPLGITFDDEGICSGCRIHEEKDYLDWNHRFEILKKKILPYKSKKKNNYDCIIPVTGAQDSYFIVYIAKYKLGLNPLLVNYNKYFNTPLGIKNLANLRNKFDCDIIFQNVNPNSVKKITKNVFMEHGNIYWPNLAGHTVFPVQIALKYKVPLILWGAHQGLEQVGMFSHTHNVEMTRRYRNDHDLFGLEADDLLSIDNNLKEEDIYQFRYPEHRELDKNGIRGIYLGNYIRWDPVIQHRKMIKLFKYQSSNFQRTFDCYDFVDCFNYMNLHDYLKLCKHGYSKVTDHASREIRYKRLTRDQAIDLVRKYELKAPKYLKLFCRWLDINKRSLDFVINRTRNKNFWHEIDIDKWRFKGLSVYFQKNGKEKKQTKISKLFKSNSDLVYDKKISYVTFGKGM